MLEHKGTRELRTKRLILRKFVISDEASMYKNLVYSILKTEFIN